MKLKPLSLLMVLASLWLIGCTNDAEEEINPTTPDSLCDTDNVLFSVDVLPVIEANCYVCHDAATKTAGINLEGYDNIKSVAVSGKLVGVISHAPGFPKMPRGRAQLPTCDIESIKQWIEDGTPEN